MACGCSKRHNVSGFTASTPRPAVAEREDPYVLTKPDGSTEEYPTRLEALAARIRAGGGTVK